MPCGPIPPAYPSATSPTHPRRVLQHPLTPGLPRSPIPGGHRATDWAGLGGTSLPSFDPAAPGRDLPPDQAAQSPRDGTPTPPSGSSGRSEPAPQQGRSPLQAGVCRCRPGVPPLRQAQAGPTAPSPPRGRSPAFRRIARPRTGGRGRGESRRCRCAPCLRPVSPSPPRSLSRSGIAPLRSAAGRLGRYPSRHAPRPAGPPTPRPHWPAAGGPRCDWWRPLREATAIGGARRPVTVLLSGAGRRWRRRR